VFDSPIPRELGEVAERPKATVLKTVEGKTSVGSNPTLSSGDSMKELDRIHELEREVEHLQAELNKWVKLCMDGEHLREKIKLQAILGTYGTVGTLEGPLGSNPSKG
jgi:hypothetical protein